MIHLPTTGKIKQVLTVLDKRDFSLFVRTVMDIRTKEQYQAPLTVSQQLVLYLYEWLKHLGFLEDAACRLILRQCNLELSKYGRWLQESPFPYTKSPAIFTLSVVARHYVVWSGSSGWFDLEEETFVEEPRTPKVTLITCNLYDCFREKQDWLDKLQGGNDAGQQRRGREHHADHPQEHSGAEREPGSTRAADPQE